jgi:hypothetical protein
MTNRLHYFFFSINKQLLIRILYILLFLNFHFNSNQSINDHHLNYTREHLIPEHNLIINDHKINRGYKISTLTHLKKILIENFCRKKIKETDFPSINEPIAANRW